MAVDLRELAREAQERACEDPLRVAPELCWTRDARGWTAGKEARALTKKRWDVRPDRVVCRPGYQGLYIHGHEEERGITWLAYLNGDVLPTGQAFLRHLEELCGRVGLPFEKNGSSPASAAYDDRAGAREPRKPPRCWPFNVTGSRCHAYPGYWVCVLPPRSGKGKKILQYRILEDGSVAPGLHAGRFWRVPGAPVWFGDSSKKRPPANAEWRELEAVERRETYRADRIADAVARDEVIYFLEGEKDVETAESAGLVADTNPGGAGKLTAIQAERFAGAEVVVIPDHDDAGLRGARRSARTLGQAGARVRVLEPLGGEPGSGFDFTDWIESLKRDRPEGWKDAARDQLARQVDVAAYESGPATKAAPAAAEPRSVEIRDFLAATLKPREWILEHLIQEKDIAMIYARRGVGKTYAAQAVAWAVVTAELDRFPEIGLLVIDAVTTLCHDATASESDSKSWDSMQSWLLSLRRRGVATLVLHHSGKTGDQRGTSKREDVMTQVLRLDRPQDYRSEEGARFELHFVKARGVVGEAARPIEVQLQSSTEGSLLWSYSDLEGSKRERAFGMFDEGLKAGEVSEELDVSRATAFRWQKEWRSQGGALSSSW